MASDDAHGLGIGPKNGKAAASEYIGPGFVGVQVAPKRRAFLVSDGDTDQLRAALLGAATIWGGMRCPILPLESDGVVRPLWLQIAGLMQVVEVVDFTNGSDQRRRWQDSGNSRWPVVSARPLEDGHFWHAHPLVAFPTEELSSKMLYLPNDRSLLALASIGDIALDDERRWWESFGTDFRLDTPEQEWIRAQVEQRGVLHATAHQDTESVTVGAFMTSIGLIWLTENRDDFKETVWFWNHRALRPNQYSPAVSVYASPNGVVNAEIRQLLVERIRQTAMTRPDVSIVSLSVAEKEMVELASLLGLRSFEATKISETIVGGGPDLTRDLTFQVNLNVAQFWAVDRAIGPQREVPVALQRPVSQLRAPTPLQWNSQLTGHGHVVFRVNAPEITGPRRKAVAELYLPNATWENGRVQVVTLPDREFNFALGMPDAATILKAACQERGMKFTLNDKGQQIRGILSVGIDPTVFRNADALGVILALTPEADRDLNRSLTALLAAGRITDPQLERVLQASFANKLAIRTINDIRSSAPCSRLAITVQRVAKVLSELVASSLVLRGLRVDCDVCSLRDFHEIQNTRPVARCVGCGSAAEYAGGVRGEPELFYRLNTLLQRVSLNGGLAVLAATALLLEEGGYIVPGADLTHNDVPVGDIDVLGWKADTLFAGEAKMTAGGFANQDHMRDIAKSVALGADIHLSVCLEELSQATCQAMQSAAEAQNMSLRILDRHALLQR